VYEIDVKLTGKISSDALKKRVEKRMPAAQISLIREITLLSPVHTGELRRNFIVGDVKTEDDGVTGKIVNDLPYAAAIDQGADPHNVSEEGIEAIAFWARKKIGLSRKESLGVAYAIAQNIRRKGQKGKFFVKEAIKQSKQKIAQMFKL
jgi:hypothetical protein